MGFFRQLISPDEAAVDSIIVGGAIALLSLIAMSCWQTYTAPGSFNALSFGGGAAAICGAIGAGKRLRDGVNNGPQ